MARIEKFSNEYVMNSLVKYIKENGIERFNVRDVAKYIGCSTQPLFRLYDNTDNLKKILKVYLHKDYEEYISKYVDKNDYLLTISYGYAMYAKEVPNAFRTLFITELAGTRTIKEVIDSSWNRDTIEAMAIQYHLSISDSEKIYRDVRFYTHGIACQLSCNSINIDRKELLLLIKNMINICLKDIKSGDLYEKYNK